MGPVRVFLLTKHPNPSVGSKEELSIAAEQFVQDIHEILRIPPPYLDHLVDAIHLLMSLIYVFWNNVFYFLFYKVVVLRTNCTADMVSDQ